MVAFCGWRGTPRMSRPPHDAFTPAPEHHFTFGLWTVGNPGRDPFGDPVRPPLSPIAIVEKLAGLGAYGVNLHDNDLVPADASAGERDRIVREFQQALAATGMKVPMATTNLFSDPVFRDGAFTSNDSRVRSYALQKTMRAIDLGVELGAGIYVFWGGREGVETNAAKSPQAAVKWSSATTSGSRWSPSPTSRAATSSSRPSATCWPSSTPSTTPTWWGSTPRWPTTRWPVSTFPTAWRRRSKPGSSSTSTSTDRSPADSTKTCASAARTPRERSSW